METLPILNPKSTDTKDTMPAITLTPAAIEFARNTICSTHALGGLRIAVVGGGCSGFNYALDIDEESDDADIVLELDGLVVYVDQHSYSLLSGTVVDYTTSFEKSGFSFSNPNAKKTCGCGSSFSV